MRDLQRNTLPAFSGRALHTSRGRPHLPDGEAMSGHRRSAFHFKATIAGHGMRSFC